MSNLISDIFSTIKNSLLDAIIKPTIVFPNDNVLSETISSEDIATYIRQFYNNLDEQQCNTINFSYGDLIKPKPVENPNELFSTTLEKYNTLAGIHPDVYWIYFLDTKNFISFHNDKIVFSINNSTTNKPPFIFHNWYQTRLDDLSIFHNWYQKRLVELLARSIQIFKFIHKNGKLENGANLNDGYWNDFFKSALDLNRFRRKKFEILDPDKHLLNNNPIGHKIICNPFFSYFKVGYLMPMKYGYKPSPFNYFLEHTHIYLMDKYCDLKNECEEMVGSLIKKKSINYDNAYFDLVRRNSFFDCNLDNEFLDLSLISVPSNKSYTLIGYRQYSTVFNLCDKKWLVPFGIDNSFLLAKPYTGNNREEFNISIIDDFLIKLEKNIESLNALLNEIKNEWANNEKRAETVFAIKQDISEKEFYLGYLKHFISELFPEKIEVI